MQPKNILITGGTGLIGNHLLELFEEKKYHSAVLSRKPGSENSFQWDLDKKYIDPNAFENTDTIIHLAGASLADGRWTAKRKQEIIESRVKSTELLYDQLKNNSHNVKTFISSSAIGIYGDTGENWVTENSLPANDFLAGVCIEWEKAAEKISSLGIRVVIIRTGIVLAKEGGALPVLSIPVKYFIGSPLGSGKQYQSWIHINDLCAIYLDAIEDEKMNGAYNAVASNPVTQKSFMQTLAKTLRRPLLPVHVPPWILKIVLGQKAEMILSGQRVSNKKLLDSGFQFKFNQLDQALKEIVQ